MALLPCGLLAVAQLVYSGTIGQARAPGEEPVPWTDCAWCVADGRGTVHFAGGWRWRDGRLEREACDAPGTVFSDGGGNLYSFYPSRAELGRVEASDDGLHARGALARLHTWELTLSAVPASCTAGFGARARFLALDRRKKSVFGWTKGGEPLGTVFSYADRTEPFVSLAVHPRSGDLLLGTGWPENAICRFGADGTERKGPAWPAKGYALSLATSGDDVWVLGSGAARLTESMAPSAQCRFGRFSTVVRGFAESADGYWLATTQGAQFFRKTDLSRCAWRVGGVANVGAMALHGGRILAGSGYRMLNFWLDDRPGDPISSDDNLRIAKRWNEKIDLIEVRDDIFYLRDATAGGVTAYDPRVTEWVFRARRQYDVKDFAFRVRSDRVRFGVNRDYAAFATPEGIRLYHRESSGRDLLVQTLPAKATALAAEGDWLVAYEPARRALVRYRLAEEGR